MTNINQIKVLMAEDEPEVLDVMSRKIAAEGYTAITACDGEEAVEKIRAAGHHCLGQEGAGGYEGENILKSIRLMVGLIPQHKQGPPDDVPA